MTTRRNLLKSSLSLAAAPVGMSVAIEVAHAEDMPKWNNETDVLVLGYGNAGSNAAIAAADAGAKVLILEKTPAGGGNVSVSSGGFVVPTNKEDYYKFQKALYELSRSEWDKDLLDLFCEESLHLGDYVSSLAPEGKIGVYGHAGYQNLPGADCVNKMSMRNVPGAKGGDRLFGIFDRAVKARNIPVLVNCPARRLVRRGNEVLGVEAVYEGNPYFVKANKAVVICTGGFQSNPELMARYIYGNPMAYLGSPAHTGDGLLMAQSMGCDLWHMNSVSALSFGDSKNY